MTNSLTSLCIEVRVVRGVLSIVIVVVEFIIEIVIAHSLQKSRDARWFGGYQFTDEWHDGWSTRCLERSEGLVGPGGSRDVELDRGGERAGCE